MSGKINIHTDIDNDIPLKTGNTMFIGSQVSENVMHVYLSVELPIYNYYLVLL